MKTLSFISKTAWVVILFMAAAQAGFAQTERQEEKKYRLHLVKEENGNKQVIDKTFSSEEEMIAFAKDNSIGVSEIEEEELTGAPEKGERIIVEKECRKLIDKLSKENCTKKVIIKKEVAKEIVEKEMTDQVKPTEAAARQIPIPTGIEESAEEKSDNISDFKFYSKAGQFHIEFKVEKPSKLKLTISDIQGREVHTEALNNYSGNFNKDIFINGLSTGTYLVDLQAGNERRTAKMVMQ